MISHALLKRTPLVDLASQYWIEPEWQDSAGARHFVPDATLSAMLAASGVPGDSESDVERSLNRSRRKLLEPVYVVRKSSQAATECIRLPISVPESRRNDYASWTLVTECGERFEGGGTMADLSVVAEEHLPDGKRLLRCVLPVPVKLDLGYHALTLSWSNPPPDDESPATAQAALIVVPDRCFVPASLEGETQVWGPFIRLASLRSDRNWGIGDFTDLKQFIDWCASEGAGMLVVDSLHTLRSFNLMESGRPCYSSKTFLSVLYIDVEAVADFRESQEVVRRVLSPAFQERLEHLRNEPLVDYLFVAREKYAILKSLYQHFRGKHLSENTERASAFREFQERGGEALEQFARHEALREWFQEMEVEAAGWRQWPEDYQNPASQAVADFARANRERIEFFQYLQWQADIQLSNAGMHCMNYHFPVGLTLTISATVDRGGADTWANRSLFADGISAGEAPHPCKPRGQSWGAAVMLPECLRESAYRPFIETVRAAMRYAGAVSIDNIIGLKQLFCIPDGLESEESTYIKYPFEDLLGVLALESHRNQCLVIGSDLGIVSDSLRTAPEAARTVCDSWGIFLHKALCLEKESRHGREYIRPRSYPSEVLISFSTSDMPTLTDYWSGHDLSADIGSMDKELRDRLVAERMLDRMALLSLLEKEGLLPPAVTVDPASVPAMSAELAVAVYTVMAKTHAQLLAFSLEDLLERKSHRGRLDPDVEYPRGRRKLTSDLGQLTQDPGLQLLVKELREVRGGYYCPLPSSRRKEHAVASAVRIPEATYRLQFNKDFTLPAATALVPYLARLGITHCYASPLLRARPGSPHGYDIANHKELNPEIGTMDQLDQFVSALRRHGMGLILDFVPNHMGVGKDNPWWMDVLENGPASEFADYFDIDWAPVKPDLLGKVLIPILGDSYGRCLTRGQLRLCFRPDQGRLFLQYFEHEFPLNPASYPIVLGHRLDVLKDRLGKDSVEVLEYQSILAALQRLPGHIEPVGFAERLREKRHQIMRLSVLCGRSPDITEFVFQNLKDFECRPKDPAAAERLHGLLQVQAYRLANWRVASDEINYRRFFDINDLAALRVEDPRVFAEMHELVLQLIAGRKIDGLRIDHPDGLFDPAGYFAGLQRLTAGALGLESALSDREPPAGPEQLPLYLVVEKILAPFEHLDPDFQVHGTTGYDFLDSVNQLLIASQNEAAIQEIFERFNGGSVAYEQLKHQCKQLILKTVLSSELQVLAHQLNRISESSWFYRDYTLNSLRQALADVVSFFPVYRTYISSDREDRAGKQYIDWAVQLAKRHSTAFDTSIYDFIRSVLLLEPLEGAFTAPNGAGNGDLKRKVQLFSRKFQQFTGPVMAKSMEDTLFYRYNRLACLNEVGGDPERFGITISAFHRLNQDRQRRRPYELLATSTHDTKRSEDVRARLAVLSEIPTVWAQEVFSWAETNRGRKSMVEDMAAPDGNDEYLIYQTLLGVWPPGLTPGGDMEPFRTRIEQYMLKAARESKAHTSWISPSEEYENALSDFIRKILSSPVNGHRNEFLDSFVRFCERLTRFGLLNSLTQTFLKLASPGVPDLYQGTEVWNFSLVDPDNRRPVNFDILNSYMKEMEPHRLSPLRSGYSPDELAAQRSYLADCLEHLEDGRLKLFLTARMLRCRKEFPRLFTRGRYYPLEINGGLSEHLVAFAREHERQWVVAVAPRAMAHLLRMDDPQKFFSQAPLPALLRADTWGDTAVVLPEPLAAARLQSVFTLELHQPADRELAVSSIFGAFPVNLLRSVRE